MYKPQLDGLRCLAFLAVFASHAHPRWPAGGAIGVCQFFALSGFLITGILMNDPDPSLGGRLRRFYARRSLRIFPLYYAVLIGLWLVGALPDAAWYFAYLDNVRVYLDHHHHWPLARMHLWSLGVEEWFYLLYPLALLAAAPARRPRVVLGLIVATKICRGAFAWYTPVPWYSLLLPVCGEYLLWGALAALWWDRRRAVSGTATALAGAAIVAAYYLFRGIPNSPAPWVLLTLDGTPDGIGFTLIVVGLWHAEGIAVKALSLAPLAYLGRISYGLYLYHCLVLFGPIGEVVHRVPGVWRLGDWGYDLPLTILIATASWYVLEKPILRLKARFAYRPAPADRHGLEVGAASVAASA